VNEIGVNLLKYVLFLFNYQNSLVAILLACSLLNADFVHVQIHTKKWNRLEHQRLNKLVDASYNSKMENRFANIRELGSKGKKSNPLVLEEFLWEMNGLKILMKMMVLIFGQPSMMLSVQHRVSKAGICLGVLLQVEVMLLLLDLLNLNRRLSQLGSVPKMQQLLIFVKMRVISKMSSHYKLNHHKQLRRDLNQVEGKLLVLVMLINFMLMICCFRLVCNFEFPYFHY
jgi:hypothetical protein